MLAFVLPGTAAQAQQLDFDIIRGEDHHIGSHRITVSQPFADQIQAQIQTDINVKILGITAYRYTHRAEESWRLDPTDGQWRLVAMRTSTNDDGAPFQVQVDMMPDGLRVVGQEAPEERVPADIQPSSYWSAQTLAATKMIGVRSGKVYDLVVQPQRDEALTVLGQTFNARKAVLVADPQVTLWYGPDDRVVRMLFHASGSDIHYVLRRKSP
ncbi:MAG: DUF6134 family protein [Rhodospirillaceae bacterium]